MNSVEVPEILQDLSPNSDAAKLLGNYFAATWEDRAATQIDDTPIQKAPPFFSGARFNEILLADGATDPAPYEITAADIAAVSCLGVNLPGRTVVELLEHRSGSIFDHLTNIDNDVDLWHPSQAGIEDKDKEGKDTHANQLWKLLNEIWGIGPVTASKLMARKRPRLIPVYDKWIKQALHLNGPNDYWTKYRNLMLSSPSGDAPLQAELKKLLQDLKLPDSVTPLRACDVILWYHANTGKTALAQKNKLGLEHTD